MYLLGILQPSSQVSIPVRILISTSNNWTLISRCDFRKTTLRGILLSLCGNQIVKIEGIYFTLVKAGKIKTAISDEA